MKKKVFFLIVLLITLSSCAGNMMRFSVDEELQKTVSEAKKKDLILLESGKNYQYWTDAQHHSYYTVTQEDGRVVDSGGFEHGTLSIRYCNEKYLSITHSAGTNAFWSRFYDCEKNILSDVYWNALAFENGLVAYQDFQGSFPYNTVIITDPFAAKNLASFQFDFANYSSPVQNINFSENGDSFEITYFNRNEELVTETKILSHSIK